MSYPLSHYTLEPVLFPNKLSKKALNGQVETTRPRGRQYCSS